MIWQIKRIVRIVLIKTKPTDIFRGFGLMKMPLFIKNNSNIDDLNKKTSLFFYEKALFTTQFLT